MTFILGAIALGALALRALWLRTVGTNPARAVEVATRVKLSTNLLVLGAQAAGYAAELLSGSRTTLPSTTSTTPTYTGGTTIPSAATFGSRTAGAVAD